MGTTISRTDASVDAARECAYRFLAAALSDPRKNAAAPVFLRRIAAVLEPMTETLREAYGAGPGSLGDGERDPAELDARPLAEALLKLEGNLAEEYDRVFGLQTPRDFPPYETEFLPNSEPFFRSQQMADIAGFYKAFALQPSKQARERPDHASLELEFMAMVLLKRRMAAERDDACRDPVETIEICDDVFVKFFESHIDWWLPAFGRLVEVRDSGGFYGALARYLCAFLAGERGFLGLEPSRLRAKPAETTEPEGCEGCTVQIEGLRA